MSLESVANAPKSTCCGHGEIRIDVRANQAPLCTLSTRPLLPGRILYFQERDVSYPKYYAWMLSRDVSLSWPHGNLLSSLSDDRKRTKPTTMDVSRSSQLEVLIKIILSPSCRTSWIQPKYSA